MDAGKRMYRCIRFQICQIDHIRKKVDMGKNSSLVYERLPDKLHKYTHRGHAQQIAA